MATKKAKRKSKPAPKAVLAAAVVPQRMYHCRCYKIGDGYEMWVLDPASGTYRGPIPCTMQQCRACNTSAAEVVGS
jgi:hypothetical protein